MALDSRNEIKESSLISKNRSPLAFTPSLPPSLPLSFLPPHHRAQIPPSVYFQRTQGDKFSGYDPEGFPTHDKEGNPLSKGVLKKLGKEWEGHKKAYAKAVGKG